MNRLPRSALALGLAGLVPFLACGLGAAGSSTIWAPRFLAALVAYGAVVLSFLGGVHWGFVIGSGDPPEPRMRLGLGVLPALAGWLALLLPLVLPEVAALAVLLGGYAATIAAEHAAWQRGLVGSAWVGLRWGLSVVVLLVLATVLTLRLLGAHLVF